MAHQDLKPDAYLATHPNGGVEVALVREAFMQARHKGFNVSALYHLTDAEASIIAAVRDRPEVFAA